MVVPIILESFDVETALDVGCGQAWWGSQLRRNGCRVTGIDGGYVTFPEENLDSFVAHDLGLPFPDVGRFDLVVCLEVAEHLAESRADGFVAELCDAAPVVLFSAAIPHQSGAGHINCQWQSWWAEKFHENGYKGDGAWLAETFDRGNYVGLPLLQWMGLTWDEQRAAEHDAEPYPHMVRWLRGPLEPVAEA